MTQNAQIEGAIHYEEQAVLWTEQGRDVYFSVLRSAIIKFGYRQAIHGIPFPVEKDKFSIFQTAREKHKKQAAI